MTGRGAVVHGRVAVGNKSCTSPVQQLVEFGRVWSGNLGDRDDRVDPIGNLYSILLAYIYASFALQLPLHAMLIYPNHLTF